jgi:Leucine-rich repeat (LRR) protein
MSVFALELIRKNRQNPKPFLDLRDFKLSELPEELSELTHLARIDLSYNYITNINILKNLTNLNLLDLRHNTVKDISSLENLTKLNSLFLNHNQITNINSLRNLTKLNSLGLGHKNLVNLKVELTDLKEFNEIKEILFELEEANIKNEEWKECLIKALDEFSRLEMAEDKAAQKTSVGIIERTFKKLKDLKDIVAIGFLTVDIQSKFPVLMGQWDSLKLLFK